ncbi:MAG: hypothetical protein A3C07_01465 [Candidatus Sungbacteria bacterium RIFCSPHIGHO2_02_FULL_47_11]|uniref:Uncharacterized protein n=1 Tax=Candidatus Sungbacteria bacterium RIFCSPHIGHO2_02_FULL_47_11 TaxID=1802270 RepID=A0A1G2KPS1_9BACT|nr:MAG: hypothetical protein A3C07_01465 [Candidatus Sungbacteria bacterium RIFCSPHIGHO2_02_FULL_47_11]
MKKLQKEVGKFIKARQWHKDHPYDVLLNVHEEADEIWNVIKHLPNERTIRKIILGHKKEFDDGIGDLLFLVLKLAVMFDINAEKSVKRTLKEFSRRFPAKKLKGFHGNVRAGGIDYKYQKGVKRWG